MGLDTLGKDFATTGIMPGYMSGQTHGAGLASVLAQTKQKQLESERYAAETPDYLKQQGYATEKARLGNIPDQMNEKYSIQDLTAQEAGLTKQVAVEKAKEAWNNLGPEKQAQAQKEAQKMSSEMIQVTTQTMLQTGNITESFNAAAQWVQANHHKLPAEYVENTLKSLEKGLVEADSKFRNNPQGFLEEIKRRQGGLVANQVATDPKTQGEIAIDTSKHGNAVDLANINNAARLSELELQNSGTLAAAGVRATSGGSTNATEAMLALQQEYIAAIQAGDQKTADIKLWQMNALNKSTPDQPSLVPGQEKKGRQIPAFGGSTNNSGTLADKIAAEEARRAANPPVRSTPQPTNAIDQIKADGAAKRKSQDAAMAAMYKKYTSLDKNSTEAKNLLTQINALAASIQ